MSTYYLRVYNDGTGSFDNNNKINGPSLPLYQPKLGHGLTQTLRGLSTTIGGVAVSSTQVSKVFSANKATYRDLKADGTWAFVETPVNDPAPTITAGALRVGCSVTDGSNIVQDTLLCCYFQGQSQADEPSQEAAQAVADQLAAQQAAQQGGNWTGVAVLA